MSDRKISAAMRSVTFLQESADGASPSAYRCGRTIDMFGAAPAPASPSALPDGARRPMTNATCGLRGFLSSRSGALQLSLESRLRRRLDGAGSTLFSLIWKRKATPAGRPYYQLAASARRTSDSGFGSWPTPTQHDAERGGQEKRATTERHGSNLQDFALTAWNTPRATEGSNGGPNQAGGALSNDAAMASWATPTTRDHKDGASTRWRIRRSTFSLGGKFTCLAPLLNGKARPTPIRHFSSGSWGIRPSGKVTRRKRLLIVPQVAAEFIKAAHV